ncbi:hypothetical protein GIB67_032907 [Kingdonia uniflora]|uniref:Rab-GAP TBC domain-containing protein n=1 Tax=Kingdonia uniflora TaxID=39325 RepID=A0A7J7L740_9MAGN|nr:hypothetical protein GIB67_032907 [Kingdonia uniflora]
MVSPARVASSIVDSENRNGGGEVDSRFVHLRSVQWRINLRILPSEASASIDELRRVTADARRRYAGLRRRILVDPPKGENISPDVVIDDPLSQNPDSAWGRFFRNAELEKVVDQDLSRLYPENGSYFQAPACQGMLRRILLLWCLTHPEYGYRQGMHELLAPLLYVLHVDVQRLSQVRKIHEDHFTDKFDDIFFAESNLSLKGKTGNVDENSSHENEIKVHSLNELEPEIQTIVLLSDAYGAEGELGILLSDRFLEHDAYSMFDALMCGGNGGAVAMIDYYSPSPASGSHTGLPPVIEASSALYHLLSVTDSSLHSHLIELEVEPQYFALRWLRVLFGREFSLEDLLKVWDEIFVSDNDKLTSATEDDVGTGLDILHSARGAFIAAIAVTMLLHLRSSLLATETATSCLQRLLNFPEDIDVEKLIKKAKTLQTLALETSVHSSPLPLLNHAFDKSKSAAVRGHSLSIGSVSPRTPLNLARESYWEEKWRVLHKAEELRQGSTSSTAGKKGFSEKIRRSLIRAESVPSPTEIKSAKRESRVPVRRSLLEDLSRQLGSEEDIEVSAPKDPSSVEIKVEGEQGLLENKVERSFLMDNIVSEDSSIFSARSSLSGDNDLENDSEKSCAGSSSSVVENEDLENEEEQSEDPLPVSYPTGSSTQNLEIGDTAHKQVVGLKERKPPSGKFPWFWKFGRNASEVTFEKGSNMEASRSSSVSNNQNNVPGLPITDACSISYRDMSEKNVMGSLKNLGQTMLENIQVIESVFQQDRGQVGENLSKNILVEKGQVTAVAALKELRKISNLLSEM